MTEGRKQLCPADLLKGAQHLQRTVVIKICVGAYVIWSLSSPNPPRKLSLPPGDTIMLNLSYWDEIIILKMCYTALHDFVLKNVQWWYRVL
jgi:hypothetical protein